MNELEVWRQKIDEIDLQLVGLLNERTTCAIEIGKVKIALGLDAYSPEREGEVIRNVTSNN
jgi:chorismate mutase